MGDDGGDERDESIHVLATHYRVAASALRHFCASTTARLPEQPYGLARHFVESVRQQAYGHVRTPFLLTRA